MTNEEKLLLRPKEIYPEIDYSSEDMASIAHYTILMWCPASMYLQRCNEVEEDSLVDSYFNTRPHLLNNAKLN